MRLSMARELMDSARGDYENGATVVDRYAEASRELAHCELSAAAGREAREKAVTAHLRRMSAVLDREAAKQAFGVGSNSPWELARARSQHAQAALWLAQIRRGQIDGGPKP
jgi:hypothetical protein